MKKFDIRIFLVIGTIAGLLLILVRLLSFDGGGTAPSYSFLAGREPITCKIADKGTEDSRGIEDRRYTYSFEADYNDLCAKAHAELTPDGFAVRTDVQILSGKEFRHRFYYLTEKFPRGAVYIYIYDNRRYIDLHDLYSNFTKSNYALSEKDGWVTVEVVYYRGWQWPF